MSETRSDGMGVQPVEHEAQTVFGHFDLRRMAGLVNNSQIRTWQVVRQPLRLLPRHDRIAIARDGQDGHGQISDQRAYVARFQHTQQGGQVRQTLLAIPRMQLTA